MKKSLIAASKAMVRGLYRVQGLEKGLSAVKVGDFKTALQEWRPLAEQGNAAAQNNLGLMHRNGEGVLKNYNEAVRWFCLSAKQGFAAAQSNLGFMYGHGYGIEEDLVLAHVWCNIGSANGDEEGAKLRDIFECKMTPEKIAEASHRATFFMSSNYLCCD
jgi:TPR repeat protein